MKKKLIIFSLAIFGLINTHAQSISQQDQTKDDKAKSLKIQIFYSNLIEGQVSMDGAFPLIKGEKIDYADDNYNVYRIKNEEIKPFLVRNDMKLYRHKKSGDAAIIANIPPGETQAFVNALKEFCNMENATQKYQGSVKNEKNVNYTAFNFRNQKSIVVVDNVDPEKDDVLYVFGYNN